MNTAEIDITNRSNIFYTYSLNFLERRSFLGHSDIILYFCSANCNNVERTEKII